MKRTHPWLLQSPGEVEDKCPVVAAEDAVFVLDGDEAGKHGTQSIFLKLSARMNPYDITKIYLPRGKDPDELTRSEIEDVILSAS